MSAPEDFVLSMEEKDRERLWNRALLPFPSGNSLECLLEYINPEDPESNRVRVRNQIKGQTDTVPLDLAYPAIKLSDQSPFETVGLDEEKVETTVVDKQQRVKSTEPVLRTLKMIPTAEASKLTDVAEGTVKRWRSGGSQTIPLEFWENYTQKIQEKEEKLDLSYVTADLVDHNRYFYGSKPIPESTVAEEISLPRLGRFGYILDNEHQDSEENRQLLELLETEDNPTGLENARYPVLNEFIRGADPDFFEIFLDNRNYFSREFAGITSYTRQQLNTTETEQDEYIEKWYSLLESIGSSTNEGVFVGTQKIGEIIDTIQDYDLDRYGEIDHDFKLE